MTFTDQIGHRIQLDSKPLRIISLVPSQTELLFYLGLDEELVGITKFCVHPKEKCRNKPRIGGTKQVNFEKIAVLNPDFIIANKEENDRTQIEQLQALYPVWTSDILNIDDALTMIKSIGELTGTTEKAAALTVQISTSLPSRSANPTSPIQAAYLIWRKPWMAVASGTFIDSMLSVGGFSNVFAAKTRYPEITLEELAAAKPQVVLLSSEPFPFREKHFEEIKQLCPTAVVKLVDGELCSWYGSRMLQEIPYLVNLYKQVQSDLILKL